MKILVVSNMFPDEKHPSYGIFVKNFCDQLDILNFKYTVSVMKKADSKIMKMIGYIRFYIGTFLKCVFGKYDLIYIHYASHSSLPVLKAYRWIKKPIYTNVHGSDVVPENSKQEKMQKYTRDILKKSSKIIVPSEYFRGYVSNKYQIPKDKIHIVHSGGVNHAVFYENSEKKIEKNNRLVVGFVGRLSYGKGWRTFLQACTLLDNINLKIIIVGNGPEEKEMMEYISQQNLGDKIKKYNLLSQKELQKVYNKLDVFIFPTEREGESLGLVALEAMACGTPVIASDFAAPADYIVNGFNGYKFEKGNAQQLSEKIKEFYDLSIIDKERMKKSAMETAKKYNTETILDQMKKVLVE